ncbi:MAG TPA: methyltransferase domain-containing protein [Bryobacteraceae bacterium]|jgi:SAM-dependent methyltransferase|nr:methyltransferase domain-containing protein [Bryobacteraceae bacterium]
MRGTGPRCIEPELLDDAPENEARQSLRDLVRINKWSGGHGLARRLVGEFSTPADQFTVLDVGSGTGDMGDAIRRGFPRALVTSLDRDSLHAALAPPPHLIADAFALPFPPRSFDFVFCSLFLHHFENGAIALLLRSFAEVARRAVLAIDLERGPLAWHALAATRWLFHWHPITLHDGPISVQAGFKREELLALAHDAGLTTARVRQHRPWARLSLSADVRTR